MSRTGGELLLELERPYRHVAVDGARDDEAALEYLDEGDAARVGLRRMRENLDGLL
jgi:hypothetical protein